jgi:hypothetical protein
MANSHFQFEDKSYYVPEEAKELDRIRLPDGRVLQPGYWGESMPENPMNCKVVEDDRQEILSATEA